MNEHERKKEKKRFNIYLILGIILSLFVHFLIILAIYPKIYTKETETKEKKKYVFITQKLPYSSTLRAKPKGETKAPPKPKPAEKKAPKPKPVIEEKPPLEKEVKPEPEVEPEKESEIETEEIEGISLEREEELITDDQGLEGEDNIIPEEIGELGGMLKSMDEKPPPPTVKPIYNVSLSPYAHDLWSSGATKPELNDVVEPVYPKEAKEKGLEGQVILDVFITEEGEVSRVSVFKGDKIFEEVAIEAVKQFTFEPALNANSEPVAAKLMLEIRFFIDWDRLRALKKR